MHAHSVTTTRHGLAAKPFDLVGGCIRLEQRRFQSPRQLESSHGVGAVSWFAVEA
jgi:hypothetical protein